MGSSLDYHVLPFAPRKLHYFHGVKGDFSRVCRNRTALDRPKRPVPAITLHADSCFVSGPAGS